MKLTETVQFYDLRRGFPVDYLQFRPAPRQREFALPSYRGSVRVRERTYLERYVVDDWYRPTDDATPPRGWLEQRFLRPCVRIEYNSRPMSVDVQPICVRVECNGFMLLCLLLLGKPLLLTLLRTDCI